MTFQSCHVTVDEHDINDAATIHIYILYNMHANHTCACLLALL